MHGRSMTVAYPATSLPHSGAASISVGDAEHGLAPTVLHDEHGTVRGGGWFPAIASPSTWETSTWPECSPSVLWLWRW
jgi:hypothetical protein